MDLAAASLLATGGDDAFPKVRFSHYRQRFSFHHRCLGSDGDYRFEKKTSCILVVGLSFHCHWEVFVVTVGPAVLRVLMS